MKTLPVLIILSLFWNAASFADRKISFHTGGQYCRDNDWNRFIARLYLFTPADSVAQKANWEVKVTYKNGANDNYSDPVISGSTTITPGQPFDVTLQPLNKPDGCNSVFQVYGTITVEGDNGSLMGSIGYITPVGGGGGNIGMSHNVTPLNKGQAF